MKKIMDSILFGCNVIEGTKDKYFKVAEAAQDKLDSMKIANLLAGDDDSVTRLENRAAAANSHVQYLNFMLKELNGIKNFVESKPMPDFNHGCIYFGNGTLYYSPEFLNYSEKDMFEIILNHIVHYTGCFYIISSADVRLSYLLSAISVCYGESVNYKDGKNIYANNKANFKHIIFDVTDNYKTFIVRNRKMMSFFKPSPDNDPKPGELLIYRIVLGNRIKLENMLVNVDGNNVISDVRSHQYGDETKKFQLA